MYSVIVVNAIGNGLVPNPIVVIVGVGISNGYSVGNFLMINPDNYSILQIRLGQEVSLHCYEKYCN